MPSNSNGIMQNMVVFVILSRQWPLGKYIRVLPYIDNKSALVHEIVCRRSGDKPPTEPLMIQSIDT